MQCKEVKELLAVYLDNELKSEEKKQIETHLSTCRECREELEGLAVMREKLREALRLRADEVSPSTYLWENVKRNIATSPKTSFWEWLGGTFHSPLWRGLTPVALVLVVVIALWQTGTFDVMTKENTYEAAHKSEAPTDTFSTEDGQSRQLEPGSVETTWAVTTTTTTQTGNSGGQSTSMPPSIVTTTTADSSNASKSEDVPTQGSIEKSIEVNQTITSSGITVTLTNINLTSTGVSVYAFIPTASLPEGTVSSSTSGYSCRLPAIAEYQLDNNSVIQAGNSECRTLDAGIQLVWGEISPYLDPIPQTAKELTFRITRLGDAEGNWEFLIPLQ